MKNQHPQNNVNGGFRKLPLKRYTMKTLPNDFLAKH